MRCSTRVLEAEWLWPLSFDRCHPIRWPGAGQEHSKRHTSPHQFLECQRIPTILPRIPRNLGNIRYGGRSNPHRSVPEGAFDPRRKPSTLGRSVTACD